MLVDYHSDKHMFKLSIDALWGTHPIYKTRIVFLTGLKRSPEGRIHLRACETADKGL
jgi:hypothetical protein